MKEVFEYAMSNVNIYIKKIVFGGCYRELKADFTLLIHVFQNFVNYIVEQTSRLLCFNTDDAIKKTRKLLVTNCFFFYFVQYNKNRSKLKHSFIHLSTSGVTSDIYSDILNDCPQFILFSIMNHSADVKSCVYIIIKDLQMLIILIILNTYYPGSLGI